MDVELTMPNGSTKLQTLHIEDSSQQFDIPSPEKPKMVIFDKGTRLLRNLQFTKPQTSGCFNSWARTEPSNAHRQPKRYSR